MLVKSIPYNEHKSFDSHREALIAFRQYYPHINTQQDINNMNANAPLEASNLNNPSGKDYFWMANTIDPTIKILREAASNRMKARNARRIDSYDFFDNDFVRENIQYPITTITLNCLKTNTNRNKATLTTDYYAHNFQTNTMNTQHTTTTTDNRSILGNISQINTKGQSNQEDVMSQLPHHTSSMSISAFQSSPKLPRHSESITSPNRQQLSPKKKPYQTQYIINFVVDIDIPPKILRDKISTQYQAHFETSNTDPMLRVGPFPANAIETNIHFSMIPGNNKQKLGHIKVRDQRQIYSIHEFISNIFPTGEAHITLNPPSTGTSRMHIDTSLPVFQDTTHNNNWNQSSP